MWKLPNNNIIKYPKPIIINNIRYPESIFTQWSADQLISKGIWPFREEGFDRNTFKSIGYTDEVRDKEIVRVHTTEPVDPAVITAREERKELEDIKNSIIDNQRELLKLLTIMYQVGRTNNLWARADFESIDGTIINRVQTMRANLTRLEELESIYNEDIV